LVLVAAVHIGLAQGNVRVIDSLRVRTDDTRDNAVPQLRFGFGSDYTDGPDTSGGKGELPFPFIGGPSGFASALLVRDFLGDPAYDYRDIRGLPDSVTTHGLSHFSLKYTIRFQAGIGRPVLQTNGALARGIDSIVVASTQPGANYRHVFFPAGGVDTVTRREITELEMTVYFDYLRAASSPHVVTFAGVGVTPNPVHRGGRVETSELFPWRGGRVIVVDVTGRPVVQTPIDPGAPAAIDIPTDAAPGLYLVIVHAHEGTLHAARLIVGP